MPQSRLKTISDQLLADGILKMRHDYGYWDQDPAVFSQTRDAFNRLGNKMSRGVREVVSRVEQGGLAAHKPLARIFKAVSKLTAEERKNAHRVYDALRVVPHPKPPRKPRYPF